MSKGSVFRSNLYALLFLPVPWPGLELHGEQLRPEQSQAVTGRACVSGGLTLQEE